MQENKELVPREFTALLNPTGNVYEAVSIISGRAKQIAAKSKRDLEAKLSEFLPRETDDLDVAYDNKERIAVCSEHERELKPSLVATEEFLKGEIFYKTTKKGYQKV